MLSAIAIDGFPNDMYALYVHLSITIPGEAKMPPGPVSIRKEQLKVLFKIKKSLSSSGKAFFGNRLFQLLYIEPVSYTHLTLPTMAVV